MKSIILLLMLIVMLTGCSALKVVPEPVPNGRIDTADNSLAVTNSGVEVKARLSEADINSYNLESVVSAFQVRISNDSGNEVAYGPDSFVLVDERGLQYSQLTPEKMREIIKRDSYYLMPYPYVGFYYLEDFQKTAFYNRFNSSLPYYYELYPQDLFTKSLSSAAIIPGMKVEGLVFFKIDMPAHQQVKLYVYRKGASKSNPPEFVLPFKVSK